MPGAPGAGTARSGAPPCPRRSPGRSRSPPVALLLCTAREGPAVGTSAAPRGHAGTAAGTAKVVEEKKENHKRGARHSPAQLPQEAVGPHQLLNACAERRG
ncbi:uncharacterized protein VK521_010381 [Ammospiza maritima maritima]